MSGGLRFLASLLCATAVVGCGSSGGFSPGALTLAGEQPAARNAARAYTLVVGDGVILRSTDSVHWTPAATRYPLVEFAAYRDGNRYWTVGGAGSMQTSTDAANWTPVWTGTGATLLKMTKGPSGTYVAVGLVGTIVASRDGRTWRRVHIGGNDLNDVVPFRRGFVAIGKRGTILTGNAAATRWTVVPLPKAAGSLNAIDTDGRTLIVVGRSGVILTSSDGRSFTMRSSGTRSHLWGVARLNGFDVVVGTAGAIVTSADGGVHWTKRASGTTASLISVRYVNGEFLAAGYDGTILASSQGSIWSRRPAGGHWALFRLSASGGH